MEALRAADHHHHHDSHTGWSHPWNQAVAWPRTTTASAMPTVSLVATRAAVAETQELRSYGGPAPSDEALVEAYFCVVGAAPAARTLCMTMTRSSSVIEEGSGVAISQPSPSGGDVHDTMKWV